MTKQLKRFYNAPQVELIEIESEQCILRGSNTERPKDVIPGWDFDDESAKDDSEFGW